MTHLRRWRSSRLGQAVTFTRRWELEFTAGGLTVQYAGRRHQLTFATGHEVTVDRSGRWPRIHIVGLDATLPCGRQSDAAEIEAEFQRIVTPLLLGALVDEAGLARAEATRHLERLAHHRLWFTEDLVAEAEAAHRELGLRSFPNGPARDAYLNTLDDPRRTDAVWALSDPVREAAQQHNARLSELELQDNRTFFDSVESSPLTDAQARAAICHDHCVRIVGAAGSGKTSTMVAKAGYLINRALVRPEQIVMLAFNASAAAELEVRAADRFERAGLKADGLTATTCQALGLRVMAEATGAKPRLAPGHEDGHDMRVLAEVIVDLRHRSVLFNSRWVTFVAVHHQTIRHSPRDHRPEPDTWDGKHQRAGWSTLAGVTVKSAAEQQVVNWLHVHGISFEYERPYEHPVADAHGHQYAPDFYYPDIGVYHEHSAVGPHEPEAAESLGSRRGADWRRAVHADHGTEMIGTLHSAMADGSALAHLEAQLRRHGLDPRVSDVVSDTVDDLRTHPLVALLRAAISHSKSNRLSDEDLRARAHGRGSGQGAFAQLLIDVRQEWDRRLGASGSIDVEDLLNLATDAVEAGAWSSPYTVVMVDEVQDISRAGAAFVRALTASPHHHLVAVGDDWQSIDRFAGADLSVLLDVESLLGPTETFVLDQTFRNPHPIAQAAAEFIGRHPAQLRKQVTGRPDPGARITLVQVSDVRSTGSAVAALVDAIPGGEDVLVIGHEDADAAMAPRARNTSFCTARRAKGLESEHVVIVGANRGAWPNERTGDSLLEVSMPSDEGFTDAEERRLFYVALTRARRSLTIVAVRDQLSPFVVELIAAGHVADPAGETVTVDVCPTCGVGQLITFQGRHGPYRGCNRFPACDGRAPSEPAAPVITEPAVPASSSRPGS